MENSENLEEITQLRGEEFERRDQGSGLKTGIYGWKKRCLYLLMVILLLTITINVILVCWLYNVLKLDSQGVDYMQSVRNGIQFTKDIYISDELISPKLFTIPGQTLSVQSLENLTLTATDHSGHHSSSIFLGNDQFSVNTSNFMVTDLWGKILFSVDEETMSLTAKELAISGDGGAVLEKCLQTPVVSAEIGSDLILEAPLKGVQAVTPAGISVESRAGDILVSGLESINLQTVDGSIKLESTNVLLPGLQSSYSFNQNYKYRYRFPTTRVYQLCMCDNGHLYLGDADSFCDDSYNLKFC